MNCQKYFSNLYYQFMNNKGIFFIILSIVQIQPFLFQRVSRRSSLSSIRSLSNTLFSFIIVRLQTAIFILSFNSQIRNSKFFWIKTSCSNLINSFIPIVYAVLWNRALDFMSFDSYLSDTQLNNKQFEKFRVVSYCFYVVFSRICLFTFLQHLM